MLFIFITLTTFECDDLKFSQSTLSYKNADKFEKVVVRDFFFLFLAAHTLAPMTTSKSHKSHSVLTTLLPV